MSILPNKIPPPAYASPESLAEQIAEFERGGGKIEQIPAGVQKIKAEAPTVFTINGSKVQVSDAN